MRPTKTTPGARIAAVERILAGQSTDKDEARKLRVHIGRIRSWVTVARRAKERNEPAPSPVEEAPLFGGSSREDEGGPSPDLERARASAGGGEEPGDEPGGSTPSDGKPPSALSGEQVVALASVTRAQLLKFYAGVIRLDPGDPRVRAAFTMGAEEREALGVFAPSISGKVQEVFGGDGSTAGMVGFGLVFVLGMVNAMSEMRGMSKAERARQAPIIAGPIAGPRPQEDVTPEPPPPMPAHPVNGIPPAASQPGEVLRSIY
jgi:hypothetical protein